MGANKKSLKYYEDNHNKNFPNSLIKVTKRIGQYIYFEDQFGECKMYVGNVGRANYTMRSSTNKTSYLINRLKYLHGNAYDFSMVEYNEKTNTKVSIICKEHGVFEKTINTLISNKNVYCPVCYNEIIRGKNKVSTTQIFIEKANIIHDYKYNYEKVEYKTARTKITIVCPDHGDFLQTPCNHLTGYGCNRCADNLTGWAYSNWEKAGLKSKNFDGFKCYIIKCFNENEEFYKIGKTYQTIKNRFKNFVYNYEILSVISGSAKRNKFIRKQIKNK